jgi:hypothetical protein
LKLLLAADYPSGSHENVESIQARKGVSDGCLVPDIQGSKIDPVCRFRKVTDPCRDYLVSRF